MTDSTPKTPSASPDTAPVGQNIGAAFKIPKPIDPLYVQPDNYTVTAIQVKHHSGPLPDPEALARYGSVDPTLPGRIMAMAERGHEAQIEREKELAQNTLTIEIAGRLFALVFAVCVILLAGFVAYLGHAQAAMWMVVAILGTTAIFTIASGKEGRTKSKRTPLPDAPENPTN